MISTELISSWLNQPVLLNKEQPEQLRELSTLFPYFLPAHYLQVLQTYKYEKAPLAELNQLFPTNPIMVYELFHTVHITETSLPSSSTKEEPLFPDEALSFTGNLDYFSGQGIQVDTQLPELKAEQEKPAPLSEEKNLMVVMSFSEWLEYLQQQSLKSRQEEADKSALRAMWQKQKLAAAIEEEEEEIPENVFKMAVNSITPKEEIISESMATVYALQGKKEKALDMYKKLSLQIPEKSTYFAKKIEDLQKGIDI